MLSWGDICAALQPAEVVGRPVAGIWGVAADSREVRPGDAFVALPGLRTDGHHFAGDAARRGAALVVGERRLAGLPVPMLVVRDSRLALARLAAAFYRQPGREVELVGITGTTGKTTVAQILSHLAAAAGRRVALVGSLGLQLDQREGPGETALYTTPPPPELHRNLRAAADRGIRRVALEITSHALFFQRVAGLELAGAVVTNLRPGEHGDIHPSFEHYVATKRRILPMLRPGAPLWTNGDDPVARTFAAPSGPTYFYGRSAGCQLRATRVRVRRDGLRFRLEGAPGSPLEHALEIFAPLLGACQVYNLLPAIGVSLAAGLPPEAVAAGCATLRPFYRRSEVIYDDTFTVIDETAGNPATFDAVFGGLLPFLEYRNLHVLFGIRGGRGAAINRANAERLTHWARRRPVQSLTYTSSRSDCLERDRPTPQEEEAVREVFRRGFPGARFVAELPEAVEAMVAGARPGDLCLILGTQALDRARQYLWALLADGARPAAAGERLQG